MAAINRESGRNGEEPKIPVFTVSKNGAILKNIFLVNQPPSSPFVFNPKPTEPDAGTKGTGQDGREETEEEEEVMIVGRHPDCNIMLSHPSISRFHLQIHSNPSQQKISVLDLSSVHGTWVSEKKIEAGTLVELKEGDTIRLGGSSRVYRLHWVPLSCAYDFDHPFVPELDVSAVEEKEEANVTADGGNVEEEFEDILCDKSRAIDSPGLIVEGTELPAFNESENLCVKIGTQVELPVPENVYSLTHGEEECSSETDSKQDNFVAVAEFQVVEAQNFSVPSEVSFEIKNQRFDEEKLSQQIDILTELVSEDEGTISSEHNDLENGSTESFEENKCALAHGNQGSKDQIMHTDSHKKRDVSNSSIENPSMDSIDASVSDRNILLEIMHQQCNKDNQMPQSESGMERLSESEKECASCRQSCTKSSLSTIWTRRGKATTVLPLQTTRSRGKTKSAAAAARYKQHNQDDSENQFSRVLFPNLDEEEEEIFTPDKENLTPNTRLLRSMKNNKIDMEDDRPSELFRESTSKLSSIINSCNEEGVFYSDKENQTPEVFRVLKTTKPASRSLKKINKIDMQDARPSELFREFTSKLSAITNICNEEDVLYSDKENQTPEVLRVLKTTKPTSGTSPRLKEMSMRQRTASSPLKSLHATSSSRSDSIVSIGAAESGFSVDCMQPLERNASPLSAKKPVGEPKRSWMMVVDTTSLLDKESRKSLQLLQGLKGTQLIVPRIVIKELDGMKRRNSLFRRTTEVSLALEWIEDSMVNMKKWIHVQKSVEEGKSVAPTPPVSPHYIFGDARVDFLGATTSSSALFSPWGSLLDAISPTAEDHILECALFFRKINPGGQIVLLSNDILLKIKAMAEGLLCETAQEFRESLVSPFSDRFMWADSSPRGQTWSCMDDIVLKEQYYKRPTKKSSRGDAASGLKLILLHNSQYGRRHIISCG